MDGKGSGHEKMNKRVRKATKSNNQPQQRHTYQCEKEERARESKREAGERPRSGRHRGCFFLFFCVFLIVSMSIIKSILMMYFRHGNQYKVYVVLNSY